MSTHDPADSPDISAAAPPDSLVHRFLTRRKADAQFSAFYRQHIRPLTGFLINHGECFQVAADMAQEVMTDAYRNWERITHPKAWVYKAASRALVRRIASVEEPVDTIPEPGDLLLRPDAIAEWEARHDALPLLRSLPIKQRQALAWTLAGFTPTDIAEQLGERTDNVRANLRLARRAAAAYLTAREEEQ
ncbi:RNA polymerase sigma factor [Streptomyces tsukubensis]|uniref:RNA polymerase sigma factor n=1 Tax=Streptomyces tsukubensis TaxID=83656 RepID=UPI00344C20A8